MSTSAERFAWFLNFRSTTLLNVVNLQRLHRVLTKQHRAASTLEASFGVKERWACRVVGQHRSTQRLEVSLATDDEQELRRWLVQFAKDHPRWSWKRAYQHRRREGHRVNKKRVQRMWRLEGLKVPYRKRKKPLHGLGVHVGAMSPIRPNAIWAMDFQFDETRDGRQLGRIPGN
jgi:putative transposase